MKQMHLYQKSFVCLIFVLILTMVVAVVPTTAADVTAADVPSSTYVEWELSSDGKTLTGDGVTYYFCNLPVGVEIFESERIYRYAYEVKLNGYYYRVTSYERGGHILWLYGRYDNGASPYVYVQKGYENLIDSFVKDGAICGSYAGQFVYTNHQKLPSGGTIYMEPATAMESLEIITPDEEASKKSYSVLDLKELDRVQVWGLESQTRALAKVLGDLYVLEDGSLGYVSYATLGNNHFDANGDFSYRSGQVDVYLVDVDTAVVLHESLYDAIYYPNKVTSEYDDVDGNDYIGASSAYEENAIAVFWVTFVMLGYMLPIAPLVVGLVFALGRKMSHPKRWYILVGLSGAWLILSIVLTVLLLA